MNGKMGERMINIPLNIREHILFGAWDFCRIFFFFCIGFGRWFVFFRGAWKSDKSTYLGFIQKHTKVCKELDGWKRFWYYNYLITVDTWSLPKFDKILNIEKKQSDIADPMPIKAIHFNVKPIIFQVKNMPSILSRTSYLLRIIGQKCKKHKIKTSCIKNNNNNRFKWTDYFPLQ